MHGTQGVRMSRAVVVALSLPCIPVLPLVPAGYPKASPLVIGHAATAVGVGLKVVTGIEEMG